MLEVYPLLPENAFFHITVPIFFTYAILTFCVQLFYFTYYSPIPKTPKYRFTQYSNFILLLRTLFSISIVVFNSKVIRLQTPAPCGIDIFILKLATNDLCTCSHQAIFWRHCRGAKR